MTDNSVDSVCATDFICVVGKRARRSSCNSSSLSRHSDKSRFSEVSLDEKKKHQRKIIIDSPKVDSISSLSDSEY